LAILDNNKGAYGPQAVVIGTCNGDGPTCRDKLQASAVASASSIISAIPLDRRAPVPRYMIAAESKPRGRMA
jgi:hypothetical protein